VLYFAYGSNMASAQIVPGARFVGPGRLDGYRLALNRRSIRWQAGVLDIVPEPGSEVWGALYELGEKQLELIDVKEGAGSSYRRIDVELDLGTAVAYEVIEKEPVEVPPSPAYRAVVLEGARERQLPSYWLRELDRRLAPGEAGTTES
jgi:gamma-glutamylcyclotransferase (GGCT)/AIG2-like uncharacterized protein YtfP